MSITTNVTKHHSVTDTTVEIMLACRAMGWTYQQTLDELKADGLEITEAAWAQYCAIRRGERS